MSSFIKYRCRKASSSALQRFSQAEKGLCLPRLNIVTVLKQTEKTIIAATRKRAFLFSSTSHA